MAKKTKVRDLANECGGDGHRYLGHMQNPKHLRKGHNTDGSAESEISSSYGKATSSEASQSAAQKMMQGFNSATGGSSSSASKKDGS